MVQEAVDGFNICAPVLPMALDNFVRRVIPELRRRGMFHTEYEGATLRAHMGLHVPASRDARGL